MDDEERFVSDAVVVGCIGLMVMFLFGLLCALVGQ
jgi:hypothetical protein